MEGTVSEAAVMSYVAETADDSEFMLVDIGCSGGIDRVWRGFGPRLRAVAIDPNLSEIERLRAIESHPGIEYIAAFANVPPQHPFAIRKGNRNHWAHNPWNRLSIARSREILKTQAFSYAQNTAATFSPEMELANSTKSIVVPDYLRAQGIKCVDFLKIDIDGKDFEVLNSFDSALNDFAVLALGLEVNFFGSDTDTDHTFHNTDRFLKARGYELFNLNIQRYSAAALPFTFSAQSQVGRPIQGDALYVRDLPNREYSALAEHLPTARLLNLVCIFAAFNLPDCAAELALCYRDRISKCCDVDHVLDLLAAQALGHVNNPLTYAEYMERAETHEFLCRSATMTVADRDAASEIRKELESLRAVLRNIEGSKFWKLRRAWVNLKSVMGW